MQIKFNKGLFGYKVYASHLKFFSEHLPIGGCIKSLGVTKDVWPVIYQRPGNNDVIQLSYCILSLAESLRELDNYCNIPKKSSKAPGLIQAIESIAIIHIPSLFNPLKAIDAVFCVSLCGLDIRY